MKRIRTNPLLNLRVYIFLMFYLFGLYILRPSFVVSNEIISIPGFIYLTIFTAFIYIVIGVNFNYFEITEKEIKVKNSWFFWVNKNISIKDISYISFPNVFHLGQTIHFKLRNTEEKIINIESFSSTQIEEFKSVLRGANLLI